MQRATENAPERPETGGAALSDPRTGLAGPSIFSLEGAKNLAYARRHCTDLAVVYFRLDALHRAQRDPCKAVAGALVREFVQCLRAGVRTEDTIARLDDERFAVVARETNAVGARILTRRVLRGLREVTTLPASLRCVSVGIATPRAYRCSDFSDYEVLAACCLQTAIGAGGNRVVAARNQDSLRQPSPRQSKPGRVEPAGAPHAGPPRQGPAPKVDVTMWLIEEGFIDQVEPDASVAERFAPLLGEDQRQAQVDLGDVRVQLTRSA